MLTLRTHGFFAVFTALSLAAAPALSPSDLQASTPGYSLMVQEGGRTLTVSTPAGVHVNLKAPLAIELPSGERIEGAGIPGEGGATFTLPEGLGEGTQLKVEFSLCDDAETWCKIMKLATSYQGEAGTLVAVKAGATGSKAKGDKPAHEAMAGLHLDFAIQNDDAAAFALARENDAYVLLDFYAVWCPPCQMLARGLSTPEIKPLLEDIVVVQMDADSHESWGAKSIYQVGGYPTMVLARADGKELARMVGYPGDEALKVWLEESQASSHTLEEWAKMRSRGDKSPEVLMGLAKALSAKGLDAEAALSYAEVLPALTDDDDIIEARSALLTQAAAKEDTKAVKAHSKALLAINPLPVDGVFAFYFGAAAAETEKTTKRILKYGIAATESSLTASDEVSHRADVYEIQGIFYDELGDPSAAKASASMSADAWLEIVNALGGRDAQALSTFRGEAGSLLGNLTDAERFEEAEEWHKVFVTAYPSEVTYHYKYAKFLRDQGRKDEAQTSAQLAFDASAGDNRLWAAKLLGQLMTANGQEAEAMALLERVIAETKLPEDPSLRTHRYVQRLQEQLTALQEGAGT